MRLAASLICGMALAVAACSPSAEIEGESATDAAPQSAATPSGKPLPDSFAGTAWRVMADDGARYVTMLDADGRYRDLRNGDAWQEGGWTAAEGPEGKQICLTPDAQGGIETCWVAGRMRGDTMIATGPEDRRIELTRVDYVGPEAQDSAEDE